MNDQQKLVIARFIQEAYANPQGQINIVGLVDFFLKTKDAQKAEIVAWVDSKKTFNTAQRDALPARKLDAEAAFDADNTNIQSVIDSL